MKKMKKRIKLNDRTILQEKKRYRWSGCSEGLYVDTSWYNMRCKIEKIEGDKIFIYDYSDNKEWEFTKDNLTKNGVVFKKLFLGLF